MARVRTRLNKLLREIDDNKSIDPYIITITDYTDSIYTFTFKGKEYKEAISGLTYLINADVEIQFDVPTYQLRQVIKDIDQ